MFNLLLFQKALFHHRLQKERAHHVLLFEDVNNLWSPVSAILLPKVINYTALIKVSVLSVLGFFP